MDNASMTPSACVQLMYNLETGFALKPLFFHILPTLSTPSR